MDLKKIFGINSDKTPQEAALETWERDRRTFFKAIARDDLEEITIIVAKYPDEAFDWVDDNRKKCLHYALHKNSIKSLRHLLDLGADVDQTSEYKDPQYSFIEVQISVSAIARATWKGKKDFVFALLQRGASTYGCSGATRNGAIIAMLDRAAKIRQEYKEAPKAPFDMKTLLKRAEPPAPQKEPAPTPSPEKLEIDLLKKQLAAALKRIDALESPAPAVILKQAMPGKKS